MSIIADMLIKEGVSYDQCKQFESFAAMLKQTNARFNLTRITDDVSMAKLHFLDSIVPAKKGLLHARQRVVDIGTGGGFPAIPLAIFLKGLSITAIEASEKKAAFVQRVSDELGLSVTCICARAEEVAHSDFRESFDVCVSRAVAPLSVLLELSAGFVRPGGRLLCYKGKGFTGEMELARSAQRPLGLSDAWICPSDIQDVEHVIVVYEKLLPLSKEYPRRFSRIQASPL